MKTIKFVYWQDGTFWLGYLQDYPDFMTQGETLEELQENLKDIYNEIIQEHIPLVTRVGELAVA
jgi:predicted RNase H-like HicB family nuclease